MRERTASWRTVWASPASINCAAASGQRGREGIKREDEGEKGIVENGLGIPGQHKLRGSLRSERERGYCMSKK